MSDRRSEVQLAPAAGSLSRLLESGDARLPDSYAGYRAAVSARLREFFAPFRGEVYDLCAYHLGWRDEQLRPIDQYDGKMLRPALCLSACAGFGDPRDAVGVAASIELLHAFSLLHDDIEDGDAERHGRPTLWKLFGLPLALNAGDSMFSLAHRLLFEVVSALPAARAARAQRIFSDACLRMIEGQHRDIEFESRPTVTTAEYVRMSKGKTGAVLGASLALGALVGGAGDTALDTLQAAGVELGLAFQAVDDVLAIWGDPAITGKAVGNDLARGKKSLPVTLAQERGWQAALDRITLDELRAELERSGARDAVQRFALEHAEAAQRGIDAAVPAAGARADLTALVRFTLARKG
ncbi:MAG TPA: polyprenyl synthetase family protein [Dehalococcoidia bacterium]|nr:polyprenyl synthetase family protein [Dehalococcoidia bacterium]